jgi:hypothetical protein
MYEAGQYYSGRVVSVGETVSSSDNFGLVLTLDNEQEGEVKHTLYFTDKSIERTREQLQALLKNPADIDNPDLLLNPARYLVGSVCEWSMREEEYQGKTKIKVGFICSRRPVTSDVRSRAAMLLQRAGQPQRSGAMDNPFADEPPPDPPSKDDYISF